MNFQILTTLWDLNDQLKFHNPGKCYNKFQNYPRFSRMYEANYRKGPQMHNYSAYEFNDVKIQKLLKPVKKYDYKLNLEQYNTMQVNQETSKQSRYSSVIEFFFTSAL